MLFWVHHYFSERHLKLSHVSVSLARSHAFIALRHIMYEILLMFEADSPYDHDCSSIQSAPTNQRIYMPMSHSLYSFVCPEQLCNGLFSYSVYHKYIILIVVLIQHYTNVLSWGLGRVRGICVKQ